MFSPEIILSAVDEIGFTLRKVEFTAGDWASTHGKVKFPAGD